MVELRGVVLAARAAADELSAITGEPCPHAAPVANTPLVVRSTSSLLASGVGEVAVVVSPRTSDRVTRLLATHLPRSDRIRFVETDDSPPFATAIAAAHAEVGGDGLVVQLGDSLLTDHLPPLIETFERTLPAVLLLARTELSAAELSPAHLRLVGSSSAPPTDEVLSGTHFVGRAGIEQAAHLAADGRTRQTVGALAATLRERGARVETCVVSGAWRYRGTVDDLLEANRMALDELAPPEKPTPRAGAEIEGRVEISPSAILERATVRGPAVIGPGAVITDSYVGPYTSVGASARLEGAEVENSILMEGALIRVPGSRIEASLIGERAIVAREFRLPSALRLRVGARGRVSLS